MEREPDRQPERDRRGKDGRRDRANGYDREDFLRHRDDSAGRATAICRGLRAMWADVRFAVRRNGER
jgi:hypothetical protein